MIPCQCKWQFKFLTNHEKEKGEIYKKISYIITCIPHNKGMEKNANLIIKNLWLGNYIAAHDINFITNEKINDIVNVTSSVSNRFNFVDYINLPIVDENACFTNIFDLMLECVHLIKNKLQENKSVLVHCKRGHHRSASIVALYLMIYCRVSLVDAVSTIKKIRPTSFRRITCMLKILIDYQCHITNTNFVN